MIKQQETIIRLLDALFPGVKIYLFGSRARGNQRPGSDIDLALDAGRKLDIIEIAQAKSVLDGLIIAQTIDVVDLLSVPVNLRDTIMREGIEWKN